MINIDLAKKMKVIKLMMQFAEVQLQSQEKETLQKSDVAFLKEYSLPDLYECLEVSIDVAKQNNFETDGVSANIKNIIHIKKLSLLDRADDFIMALAHHNDNNHECDKAHEKLEVDIEKTRLTKHEVTDLFNLINEALGYMDEQA